MSITTLNIREDSFLVNGKKTYSEIENSNGNVHGLLMNARFIQGIFDDKTSRSRYNRFGCLFDPEKNTDDLIRALPAWYKYGLRAFTVGFQGGGPCYTTDSNLIDNNPFACDGKSMDPSYAARMDRLIKAADKIGMAIIVSYFYGMQSRRLEGGQAVINAVKTATRFLKDGGYTNVIIEIANEQNVEAFKVHPILYQSEGIVALMEIARHETDSLPIGCSLTGGEADKEITQASDVVLIHGNGCSRGSYHRLIKTVREWAPGKPVVCNEDSPAIGQLNVALKTRTSWGYYNNMTKQEPPIDWGITRGEDEFFAYRMAEGIGIKQPEIPRERQYYLQGLEPDMTCDGKRWIRLASLYPETIDDVEFYRNGVIVDTAFDEPFSLNYCSNWYQHPWFVKPDDKLWESMVHLKDGRVIQVKRDDTVFS